MYVVKQRLRNLKVACTVTIVTGVKLNPLAVIVKAGNPG